MTDGRISAGLFAFAQCPVSQGHLQGPSARSRVSFTTSAEGASSMVAHSALSFTSCIRSSTGLAHSKKAAGRSEEVPTLSTQRAKLVSPCSKLVRLHRLTFGEEVTNELDQTMTVGALFEARVGDRKRADFCNPEPRGTEAWYKGLRQPGMSTMLLPGSPNPHHPILIRGDPGHAVPIRIHD